MDKERMLPLLLLLGLGALFFLVPRRVPAQPTVFPEEPLLKRPEEPLLKRPEEPVGGDLVRIKGKKGITRVSLKDNTLQIEHPPIKRGRVVYYPAPVNIDLGKLFGFLRRRKEEKKA